MYKDKEKQKQAVRKAVKKHRVLQQGITSGRGITAPKAKGITRVSQGMTSEFAQHLPSDVQSRIHATLRTRARLGLPDDSADRWHRAVSYDKWIQDGRPDEDVAALASMIVDGRVKILNESLGDLADEVRVGVYGPTVCECVEMLA